jgi:hypothetical protein
VFSFQYRDFDTLLLADAWKYKKETGLKSWDNEDVAKAMTAVRNKTMSYLQLPSRAVPGSERCARVHSSSDPSQTIQSKLGRKPIFLQLLNRSSLKIR